MKTHRLLAVSLLAASAFVSSAAIGNSSAFVDMEFSSCGIPTENGPVNVSNVHIVSSAQAGQSHLKCSGDVTPPADGRAWKDNDFVCGVVVQSGPGEDDFYVATTNDSQVRVSASGKATMHCFLSD